MEISLIGDRVLKIDVNETLASAIRDLGQQCGNLYELVSVQSTTNSYLLVVDDNYTPSEVTQWLRGQLEDSVGSVFDDLAEQEPPLGHIHYSKTHKKWREEAERALIVLVLAEYFSSDDTEAARLIKAEAERAKVETNKDLRNSSSLRKITVYRSNRQE